MWDRKKIKEKVISSSDKYGFNNKQQESQLLRILVGCKAQEVYEGLIAIFMEEHENSPIRQEFAGRLLYQINPEAEFDIKNELKKCLPYFDRSVEHMPFYFVKQCGIAEVMRVVETYQKHNLSDRENESLRTIKFWLNNYEGWIERTGGSI
ncbi:hypothetical protein SG34_006270 [Thalassomonas viridans]|uniref:Uncharacterized protein n=1 Tax=Thalassomonas viridans TaxID=137584 RepID=A0AAF0C8J9_9GAMM|nr:hypothetical protein [Thalassomonas viridans]WDE06522.1 hypothetical protein SG34_006270 [Thalassomonas viridans]